MICRFHPEGAVLGVTQHCYQDSHTEPAFSPWTLNTDRGLQVPPCESTCLPFFHPFRGIAFSVVAIHTLSDREPFLR